MDHTRFPLIDLKGHKLTLDSGGIEVNSYSHAASITGGIVTSTESFLKVRSLGARLPRADGSLYIDSVIADSSHSVGVRFSGGSGGLVFEGNQSNTFTGNVEVSGDHNQLFLNKWNGAVAVRSDILIEKGQLVFHRSDQLSKTSSVTLKDNAVFIYSLYYNHSITNTFKNLVVEEGGIIQFEHKQEANSLNPKYYLYLDDLIINNGGLLTIKDWQDGRDFLLVRKTSQHLTDALKKMEFKGYNPADIHLRDYNSDYWQISALPEPTTYGAIVSTVGLVLAAWQRCKRPPRG